jgi:hypothetical protein
VANTVGTTALPAVQGPSGGEADNQTDRFHLFYRSSLQRGLHLLVASSAPQGLLKIIGFHAAVIGLLGKTYCLGMTKQSHSTHGKG